MANLIPLCVGSRFPSRFTPSYKEGWVNREKRETFPKYPESTKTGKAGKAGKRIDVRLRR